MNALTTAQSRALSEPAMSEAKLIDVMGSSLYPGASRESIEMALSYCIAAGLDPLQKPVHLVPMSVKTGTKNAYGDDEYANRDVVMPGIGLYRTQAARTGAYAGMDQPEFGPMLTLSYKRKHTDWVKQSGKEKKQPVVTWVDAEVSYPEWCKVTVYRIVGGVRCAFSAIEFWTENYATASKNTDAPNAMWAKRPRGQLKKCAEAQALRAGFPEVGNQPTAEEMEGKVFDVDAAPTLDVEAAPVGVTMPQSKSKTADVSDAVVIEKTAPAPNLGLATAGEKAYLSKQAERHGVTIEEACAAVGVTDFANLTADGFIAIRDFYREKS